MFAQLIGQSAEHVFAEAGAAGPFQCRLCGERSRDELLALRVDGRKHRGFKRNPINRGNLPQLIDGRARFAVFARTPIDSFQFHQLDGVSRPYPGKGN